jgi:hypothetical protein
MNSGKRRRFSLAAQTQIYQHCLQRMYEAGDRGWSYRAGWKILNSRRSLLLLI